MRFCDKYLSTQHRTEDVQKFSSARKGDEMTEVVTSSAAFQQLNLLAPRQQAFVVERQGVDAGFTTADTAAASVDHSADTFAQFQAPVITEDGGETKVHDKVPQTDTGQTSDQAAGDNDNSSTYEKAKVVAAANGSAKKVVLVEVAAYADAATITNAPPEAAAAVTA